MEEWMRHLRPFDAELIRRELEESAPKIRAQIEALERCKKVSAETMRFMVTI